MYTDRYSLPLLYAGQAQKEVTFNEAVTRLDFLTSPAVETMAINVPPVDLVTGQCWIVGAAPSGDWVGHAGELAGWTDGGWRFIVPRIGMFVWVVDQGWWARFDGGKWIGGDVAARSLIIGGVQVVGERQSSINNPIGGANIDLEAREKMIQILDVLRMHGLIAS
jgi:hypothetical protein